MSYDPNEMMLELFRAEVESHSEALTGSLLKLEQDPTAVGLLDGMMRAAHSIKGAARIVRVDAAVDVAHVMEDCFVAAQRGELVLQPAGIDILLRAVDLLGQVSEASKNPSVNWDSFQPAIKSTVGLLRSVLQGRSPGDGDLHPSSPSMPTPPQASAHSDAPELQLAENRLAENQESTENQPPAECLPSAENLPIGSPAESLRRTELPVLRIFVPEILHVNNAEAIRVQLLSALESQTLQEPLILDFSRTQDLDAVGLALLHSVNRLMASTSRRLQFEKASPALSRILQTVCIGATLGDVERGSEGIQDGK